MEIEIVTTKKKLTKAIVNQMRHASIAAIRHGTALGYLINVRQKIWRSILIFYNDEYFVMPHKIC